jgi:hypothetical protein
VDERSFTAPSAIGNIAGSRRAQIQSASVGGDLRVRVRHREYVEDITGSVSFAVQQLNINPGLSSLFPWLSQLAGLFESYKFNKLVFQYRTESATAQVGKAMLMVDWDVLDAAPANKVAMMQERTKADAQTWVNFDLPCDLSDLLKFGVQRFVRVGSAPANTDLKTYDVGMLNVATQGCTNSPVIGELYVEYDIELITPNTASNSSASTEVIASNGGSVSNTNMSGAAPVYESSGPIIGATIAANTITFPQVGQYLLHIVWTGSLSAITYSTGSATVLAVDPILTSGTGAELILAVTVTAANQTVIFTGPTGTVTVTYIIITPVAVALL